MEQENILIGLAQLAAVFAGFLAMIVAVASRESRLDPVSALHARSILYASFITMFASLCPLVLAEAGLSEALAWRIAAGGVMPIALPTFAESLRYYWRLSPEHRRVFGIFVPALSFGLHGTGMIIAILVAAGQLAGPIVIAAIVLGLMAAAVNFIAMALQKWL